MPLAPASLASRFLEPLTHPWAVATGGLLSLGVNGGASPLAAVRVALRLLRLLLAL